MRRFIEGAVLLVSMLLAVKWMLDPSGPYEPFLAFIGAAWASLDFFFGKRQQELPAEPIPTQRIPAAVVPQTSGKPGQKEVALPSYTWNSSSDFFAERFSSAFPGVRTTTWFNGQDAVERLSILLKSPLTFKNRGLGQLSPIWWFGRGNLQIENFRRLDTRTVLVNFDEYKISRIAGVYSTNYRRLWVYVETEPMPPIGLYLESQKKLEAAGAKGDTYAEEYAIFANQHKITRSEYDDGHANIGGKIVEVAGNSELRVRYLTPYNFVICSHDSPINNVQFDQDLEDFLDRMLRDPTVLPKYEELINKLPINRNP